jgi:hypothetical protein
MRTILAVALALTGLVTLDLGAADAAGWSVRICRDATEASAINVWVATSEGAEKGMPTMAWKSDDQKTDIPVAGDASTADSIWVQAESVPAGGKFVLCALHDEKVVKTISGTTESAQQVSKTGSDTSCPCAK